jgi:hypothetical protein
MSEILKAMLNLTEEEQALVLKLISGMADAKTEAVENRANIEEDKTPPIAPKRTQKGKRGRGGQNRASRMPQNKKLDNEGQSSHIISTGPQRARSGPVGRKGKANPNRQDNRNQRPGVDGPTRGKKGKGMACRNEPIQLSGENRFLEMDEYHEEQQDIEFDRKVHSGRKPRRKKFRPNPMVEVECQDCGYLFDVDSNILLVDPDTKQYIYTCNDCSVRR